MNSENRKILLQTLMTLPAVVFIAFKSTLLNLFFGSPAQDKAQHPLGALMEVLAWFCVGWLLSTVLNRILLKNWERRSKRAFPKLLKDIINAAIFFAVALYVLASVFNAPIAGVVAGSSVMAAIVGLAVTRMISDVFSGVALSLEAAYSIGDWLEVEMKTRASGYITGKVTEINWRATRLHTKADEMVIIPNSEMAKMRFINFSIPEKHYRAEVQVSLSHTIPAERVKRILSAALKSTPGAMTAPAPKITLLRFGQRGVLWCVRFWIGDFSQNRKVVKAVHESILRHLQIAGIGLSYNRVDYQLINAEADELDKRPIKESLVRRIELFESLDSDQLAILSEGMKERFFPSKAAIVSQGNEGSSLFIVAEGLVSVYVRDDKEKDRKVSLIDPGGYFGEMSLLTGEPRSATIRAESDVVCYELESEILLPIFAASPEIMHKMCNIMADRQLGLLKALEEKAPKQATEEREKQTNWLLKKMQNFFGIRSGPSHTEA